jgi:putative Mn2+ efflux pump MntP
MEERKISIATIGTACNDDIIIGCFSIIMQPLSSIISRKISKTHCRHPVTEKKKNV